MKKIASLVLALFIITVSFSQETTTGENITSDPNNKTKVVIVPFESRMYLSDIDRNLATKNKMNFQEIKAKFRAALDREIFISLKSHYQPFSFYSIAPEEASKELAYIYNSIGYKYEVMPKEEVIKKENAASKLLAKFKNKKKEEEYIEAGIRDGEIVSQIDNREKYMKTVLSNDKLINNLNEKYHAGHYVFINELDIKKSADNVYQASEELFKREIKIHYTIINADGKEQNAGAIKAYFPSGENDVDKIVKVHFPLIAQRIVAKLAGEDSTENE